MSLANASQMNEQFVVAIYKEDGELSVIEPGPTPKIVAVNRISGRIMAPSLWTEP
jgi:hypothetical protein